MTEKEKLEYHIFKEQTKYKVNAYKTIIKILKKMYKLSNEDLADLYLQNIDTTKIRINNYNLAKADILKLLK